MGRLDDYKLTFQQERGGAPERRYARTREGEVVTPLGDGNAARTRMTNLTQGATAFFFSVSSPITYPIELTSVQENKDDAIVLLMCHSGAADFRLDRVRKGVVARPGRLRMYGGSSGVGTTRIRPGSGEYGVAGFGLPLEWLAGQVGAEDAPKLFRRAMEKGALDGQFLMDMEKAPALGRISQDMRTHPYEGLTERLFFQSRALGALTEVFDQLDRRGAGPRSAAPGRRERRRIFEARDLLLARTVAPPSLTELAAMAGMSGKKLNAGFHTLFGMTVFEYLRSHQLDMARRSIEKGEYNVAEASYRSGYAHPSNFIAAYRKKFGRTPGASLKK